MTAPDRRRLTGTRATLAALALALPSALLLTSPAASAASPTTVTLNPVPPDFYTCTPNGQGTHCAGGFSSAYGPVPSGIVCAPGADAFEVLDQAVELTRAERWYDRNGDLIKRRVVHTFTDAILSSPTGAQVPYSQRDTDTDVLAVPGELTSATTYTTTSLRATVPGLGAVLIEKGRLVRGPDGEVQKQAGRHDLTDYFSSDPSALSALCAALS